MEPRHAGAVSVDRRPLQVKPWTGRNPAKPQPGGLFVPELWANEIMEEFKKDMAGMSQIMKEVDNEYAVARKESQSQILRRGK